MSEPSSSGNSLLFFRSLLLAFAFACVSLGFPFSTKSLTAMLSKTATTTVAAVEATTSTASVVEAATVSSTPLLVASATPGAGSDKLFEVDVAAKKVKAVAVETGWRQGALQASALHIEPKATGEVSLLVGKDWEVLLRDKSGIAYQEARLLGMDGADHALILARKDRYVVVRVSRTGSIQELATVKDTEYVLSWAAGKVWLSSFQPGQGIELEPMGPSELIAIDSQGQRQVVLMSDAVITKIVPFSTSHLAFVTDEGSSVFDGKKVTSLSGTPLLWQDEMHLLYARGTLLQLLDVTTGSSTELVSLPSSASAAAVK